MELLCLENLWQDAAETLKQKHLIIVCNTKKMSPSLIQDTFNMDSEYFSDEEFEQVISMFGAMDIPMEFFTYEDDFFLYILNQKAKSNADIIVYNAAQSGFGVGRKSLIPSFCNLHGLSYTGSNSYVVSLCRHKYHVNRLLSQAGIHVPKTWMYSEGWLFNQPPNGIKIILKPIYESSSIGIDTQAVQIYTPKIDEYIKALVAKHKQPIIAQEFINGYEAEVPQLRVGIQTYTFSPVGISIEGKHFLQDDFLDYNRIYFDKYEFYDFEKESPYAADMCKCATDVALALGMEGLCRVDFRIQSDGIFYVMDVSTNPHFIAHSSTAYAFNKLGLSPQHIAKTILSAAIMRGKKYV